MKKTKRLVISILSVFIIILGLITITNTEVTFAQEDNVYYIDELNEGDFIPNGATLIGAKEYYTSSIVTNAKIFLEPSETDTNLGEQIQAITIVSNNAEVINDYKGYFQNSTETYEGWLVRETETDIHANEYRIYLSPTKTYSKVNVNEDYEIELECDNSEPSPMIWFKAKDVNNVKVNTPVESLWTIENGTYSYSLDSGKNLDEDLTSSLEIEYNGKTGDVLSFDAKEIYGEIEYTLKDTSNSLTVGRNKYETIMLPIETSGNQSFIINNLLFGRYESYDNKYHYTPQYFSIKNIKVLTPLNTGEKLDTSLVEDGDTIYYECGCSNGTLFRNTIEYKEETTEENTPEVTNPETNSNIIYLLILIGMFSATAILIKYNSDKLKIN